MIDGLWTIGNIQTEDLNGVTLEPRENLLLIWENIWRLVKLKSWGTQYLLSNIACDSDSGSSELVKLRNPDKLSECLILMISLFRPPGLFWFSSNIKYRILSGLQLSPRFMNYWLFCFTIFKDPLTTSQGRKISQIILQKSPPDFNEN